MLQHATAGRCWTRAKPASAMAQPDDSFATRAVHGAQTDQPRNRPASLPIYQSAGWEFRDLDEVDAIYEHRAPGAVYGTDGLPNVVALEAAVRDLEGAQAALATSGGMAAFLALFLTQLSYGDRVLASRDLYGNTTRLLGDLKGFGIVTTAIDMTDLGAVTRELRSGARIVLAETISNPRMRVVDLQALAQAAHASNALLVIDNTFATPYHCRPLQLGADLVIESATKFIGGHHDVVLGLIAGSSERMESIRRLAVRSSMVPGAFDAWLATRSLPTLAARMERASLSALRLASWLAGRPGVSAVHYPGLTEHPDHAAAKRVLSNGFGAMLSFEIDGGREAVNDFLRQLRMVRLVLSLGGAATTLSHPATSSHRALNPQERAALGIHDGFLRMSVGLEDITDIEADLARALRQA